MPVIKKPKSPFGDKTAGEWFVENVMPSQAEGELKRKQERNVSTLIDLLIPSNMKESIDALFGTVFNVFRGTIRKPIGEMVKLMDVPKRPRAYAKALKEGNLKSYTGGFKKQYRIPGGGDYAPPGYPNILYSTEDILYSHEYPTLGDIKTHFDDEAIRQGVDIWKIYKNEESLIQAAQKFKHKFAQTLGFAIPEKSLIREAQGGSYLAKGETSSWFSGSDKYGVIRPPGQRHIKLRFGAKPGWVRYMKSRSKESPESMSDWMHQLRGLIVHDKL